MYIGIYFSNQQVAQAIQIGSKMGNVMILQIMKSVNLMAETAADQTLMTNIAQNAYATL